MIVNATNFRPLRGLVLVRRDKPESENGGIIIPENVQTYGWRATVLRAGPEATSYIEGENILFLKEFTVLPFFDRTLALTDAKHILAKLLVVDNTEVIVPQNKFVLAEPHSIVKRLDSIYLPDKSKAPPQSGHVIRKSLECLDVQVNCNIWFTANTGVNCIEDDAAYKLIDESDVLAIEKNW